MFTVDELQYCLKFDFKIIKNEILSHHSKKKRESLNIYVESSITFSCFFLLYSSVYSRHISSTWEKKVDSLFRFPLKRYSVVFFL